MIGHAVQRVNLISSLHIAIVSWNCIEVTELPNIFELINNGKTENGTFPSLGRYASRVADCRHLALSCLWAVVIPRYRSQPAAFSNIWLRSVTEVPMINHGSRVAPGIRVIRADRRTCQSLNLRLIPSDACEISFTPRSGNRPRTSFPAVVFPLLRSQHPAPGVPPSARAPGVLMLQSPSSLVPPCAGITSHAPAPLIAYPVTRTKSPTVKNSPLPATPAPPAAHGTGIFAQSAPAPRPVPALLNNRP